MRNIGNIGGVGGNIGGGSRCFSSIRSLLHGSNEPQTWSKTLQRGKYVHELQIHSVKPKAREEYLGLVKEHYSRIASEPKFLLGLFGSWETNVGDLDQVCAFYSGYPYLAVRPLSWIR
jgi:hypothetical protein